MKRSARGIVPIRYKKIPRIKQYVVSATYFDRETGRPEIKSVYCDTRREAMLIRNTQNLWPGVELLDTAGKAYIQIIKISYTNCLSYRVSKYSSTREK